VKKAAEDRGVEVVGMDDEEVFGKQLFALNFGEAIKRGLLTDYRVVIIGVDDPTISAWIEHRKLLKADSDIEMDAESLAAQVGLLKAIKDYDLHRLISFHSRVSRAEDFSKDIHKVLSWIDEKHKPSGELKSDFVSGEMPTDKRRKKLAQLKELKDNQRGLLTNARCLSEGVDVPSLDGVAFIDPRSSQIDIIQAVGRAIRLNENKKAGTIVLPVFIGKTDDPGQALEDGNFKPIWDVLNALKAHDDVLADELNQIRTEIGRKGSGKVNPEAFSKITIDLPVGIDKSFGDGLRTLLVERTTDSWDYWYGLLIAWRLETGKFIPAINDEFRQKKIGVWVGTQRTNYKRGLLDKNRIEKIQSLECWSWDLVEDLWLEGHSAIKLYFNQ
jgi:predicted helicase